MYVQNKAKRKLLSKTGTGKNKQIVDFRPIFFSLNLGKKRLVFK